MHKVRSADGTDIAYDRSGEGPPLVLVTGAFCNRFSTKALAAGLGSDFTVYEFDRCGRGDSGDRSGYSISGEVEDLRAVIEATGGPADVYGHSSGAALALEAAAQGVPMRRLAVYEPPYVDDGSRPADFADQLRELVAAGHRDEAARRFLALTGAPPQMLEMIQGSPWWPNMLALAHTLAYDITLSEHGSHERDWLAAISVPTTAMAGGASAPWAQAAMREVGETVPGAEQRVVPGQNHQLSDEVIAPILRELFG